jgi:hypothetical protein
MSGVYGVIFFFSGLITGVAIYHFCLRAASKMIHQADSGEVPGRDTGQIEQEYAE